MLECVINISEGRNRRLLDEFVHVAGESFLDLHSDPDHNRSVFTLAGADVVADAIALTGAAIGNLDIQNHSGAHPRLGVVDVVPFIPLGNAGLAQPYVLAEAISARAKFADYVSDIFGVPCFFYGPERSLPSIRKTAFDPLQPDRGPNTSHPSAGAICVGARGVLVAYNVNVERLNSTQLTAIASVLRSEAVRALGFVLHGSMQVSCNLIDPTVVTIEEVYDHICTLVHRSGGKVRSAELVGLVPEALLTPIDQERWPELDLSSAKTIESRISLRSGGG